MESKIKHPTATPIAEDVVIREAEVFVDPNFTNGDPALSDDEVAFFKENGFLVKRRIMDEHEAFERIVDYVWENVPRGLMKREDTQTWLGMPHEQWTEDDEASVGQLTGSGWKMRSRGGIGTEPFFVDKIANHPGMRKMVSLFIGKPVKQVQRARGAYIAFPKPPGSKGRLGPHADHISSQLSAMVLVDEVPPKCGGFTIWPGSHRLLYPCWDTTQGSGLSSDRAAQYARIRDGALRDITPIEFPGNAGDVIFWHPRLLHSPGINHSADFDRPVLRVIVPCDYQKDGRTFFDDLVYGPGPNHQWWIDARNFREDVPPTADNMWDGWFDFSS